MKVTVAVIVLLVALLGAARAEMGFSEFVTTFNKVYVGEAERIYRETIFNATVERITRENANPNATFQQKVTQFADRTPEELSNLFLRSGNSENSHTQLSSEGSNSTDLPINMTFSEFVTTFKKVYKDESERAIRESVFQATVERINRDNSDPTFKFKQTITQFADRTVEQLNEAKSVGSELTPGVRVEAVTVPDSLDWGDKGGISLIQDQGTNCVAGWAFASVAAAETMTYLGNRTIGFFSEEYVLECTSGGSCKGGDLLAGMKLMLKNGAPPRLLYPYTADSSTTPKTSGICDKTWNLQIAKVVHIGEYSSIDDAKMKELLVVAPVATLFYPNGAGFHTYSDGVYSSCPDNPSTSDLTHAVQVIGYDTSGNYIIKNSWGYSWGNFGMGLISNTKDCGIKRKVYQYTGQWRMLAWAVFAVLLAML